MEDTVDQPMVQCHARVGLSLEAITWRLGSVQRLQLEV